MVTLTLQIYKHGESRILRLYMPWGCAPQRDQGAETLVGGSGPKAPEAEDLKPKTEDILKI